MPSERVESAYVKRRRLRNVLRESRITASLTQQEAAKATYWSLSKIVRIETGVVPVTPSDVRALLHAYEVVEASRVNQLVRLADEARSEKIWSTFKDVHSDAAIELFATEGSASALFNYEPYLIPGLLQTEEYMRSLVPALGVPEKSVSRVVEGRLLRQEVLENPSPPEIHCILGESALSLSLGRGEIMRNQVAHLQAMRARPEISVSILPLSSGPHRSLSSPFLVLQFKDPELSDLLHLESSASADSTIRDEPELISDHLNQYVELEAASVPESDFDAFVESIVDARHRQD